MNFFISLAGLLILLACLPLASAAYMNFGNYNGTCGNNRGGGAFQYLACDTADIDITGLPRSSGDGMQSYGWIGDAAAAYANAAATGQAAFNGTLMMWGGNTGDKAVYTKSINGTNFSLSVKHAWSSSDVGTNKGGAMGLQDASGTIEIARIGIRGASSGTNYVYWLDGGGVTDSGIAFNNNSLYTEYVFYVAKNNLTIWANGVKIASTNSTTNYNIGRWQETLAYDSGINWVDNLFQWNGTLDMRPKYNIVATGTPLIRSITPNGTIFNYQINLSCNMTDTYNITNLTLTVYNVTNHVLLMTNNSIPPAGITTNYTKSWNFSLYTDGIYNWTCSGCDIFGTCANSQDGNSSFIRDTVMPTITLNPRNLFDTANMSRYDQYADSALLNITFSDDTNLFAWEINISRGGVQYYDNSSTGLNNQSFNFSINYSFSPLVDGAYDVALIAADGHHYIGGYQIKDYGVDTFLNKITFDTSETEKISLWCEGAYATESTREINSYQLNWKFLLPSSSRSCYVESVTGDKIYYLDNKKYNGWMVVYNKETKLGNWIDWEGASTSYTIKRLSDSKLQIDFTGLKDSYNMITRSIGGLNVYTVHYSFYHGTMAPSYSGAALAGTAQSYQLSVSKDNQYIQNVEAVMLYNNSIVSNTKTSDAGHYYFTSSFNAPQSQGNYSVAWIANITQYNGSSYTRLYNGTQSVGLASASFYFYDEQNSSAITEPITMYFYGLFGTSSYSGIISNITLTDLNIGTYRVEALSASYARRGKDFTITNASGNFSLYLLQANTQNYNIYFTVKYANSESANNVTMNFYRMYNTTRALIAQCITDYAGQCRMMLDSANSYNIEFSKGGILLKDIDLTPTLTAYTIYLDFEPVSQYSNSFEGIYFSITPMDQLVNMSNTMLNFTLYLADAHASLDYFGMIIENTTAACIPASCQVTASGLPSGGTVGIALNISQPGQFKAHYFFKKQNFAVQYINERWFTIAYVQKMIKDIVSQFIEVGTNFGAGGRIVIASLGMTVTMAAAAAFGIYGLGLLLVAVLAMIFMVKIGFVSLLIGTILCIWGVVVWAFLARDTD